MGCRHGRGHHIRELRLSCELVRVLAAVSHDRVPLEAALHPKCEIPITPTLCVTDELTENLADLFVDKLFPEAGVIDTQRGLTEYNWDDTLVKKAMIRRATCVYLLADESTFNRVAFSTIRGLADIHALVPNEEPPDFLAKLKERNIAIYVAGNVLADER